MREKTAMRVAGMAALLLATALTGCDDIEAMVDEAADKGGTDVPEEARDSPVDTEALRRRISHQSFN
jgi:hypothetical protein